MNRETTAGQRQVFVSYSRRDVSIVDPLVREIEKLGYLVLIDRNFVGTQRYAAPIVSGIRASEVVAVMCSENSFNSDHVIREIYIAGDYRKPFVAFQLDATDFPDEVIYFLTGFPRIPVANADPARIRTEITRLVSAHR